MTVQVTDGLIPSDSDVEVEIKIRTHLNITPFVAKQRSNVALVLHCGQSFTVGEPVLQLGSRICWIVPVFLAPPWATSKEDQQIKLGEFEIDAQTGEMINSNERCRVIRLIGNRLLQESASAPTRS